MQGWLVGYNVNIDKTLFADENGVLEEFEGMYLYTNLSRKFYKDCIKSNSIFLEGVITNKAEIMLENSEETWEEIIESAIMHPCFPKDLRGCFCGYYFNELREMIIFTDHVAGKNLFYYYSQGRFVVSSRFEWVVNILKYNKIEFNIDEKAVKYMLTYGFMIDNSTYISEVKKVMPGHKIILGKAKNADIEYHKFTMKSETNISEDEAMRKIDNAFRVAVKREFEKDKEYGYKHLVDLSGGLDSRMVSWVAHELGYKNQTNFVYCRAEYMDYKISSNIAKDLKHEYYFKQLDDLQWFYEIEEILKLNNGMALYSAVTGGKQFLEILDSKLYGVEHTGMLGDVILSTYAQSVVEAMQKPRFGLRQFSSRLKYEYDDRLLEQYESQELFDIYTRGFLGMLATYGIRQNYFEVSSPFLDVDFIDVCFSLPMKYRVNHNIYIKWMNKYYKNSTKYGWEKWHGLKPKSKNIIFKKVVGLFREGIRHMRYLVGSKLKDSMNPFEHWYKTNEEMRKFLDTYYHKNVKYCDVLSEIKKDIQNMFEIGTCLEKCQILTVIGMLKMCLEEEGWN